MIFSRCVPQKADPWNSQSRMATIELPFHQLTQYHKSILAINRSRRLTTSPINSNLIDSILEYSQQATDMPLSNRRPRHRRRHHRCQWRHFRPRSRTVFRPTMTSLRRGCCRLPCAGLRAPRLWPRWLFGGLVSSDTKADVGRRTMSENGRVTGRRPRSDRRNTRYRRPQWRRGRRNSWRLIDLLQ